MLTIYEAMNLPALKGTKLIAGIKGKDQPINWVTTIEIIEDISRFIDGEFVVTTGYGLMENESHLIKMIELIQSKKLSGLAFYTGFYLTAIPEKLIKEADKYDLPLIEIPPTINFSTITKAIVEQIANEQMRLLKDSLTIHKEMTKLALNNVGLDDVLSKLSSLTESTLLVLNDIGELQATENIHPDKIEINENHIIINGEKQSINNLFMKIHGEAYDNAFLLNDFFCFRAPVKAHSFTYGYLVAFQYKANWSEMDDIIMDHVSTLVGIELIKQYAIEETRVRLQGELIEEILMKDKFNKKAALKRGSKLGYDLSQPHAVMFFKITSEENRNYEKKEDLSSHLHYVIAQSLLPSGRQSILLPKVDTLVALVQVDYYEKLKEKEAIKKLGNVIHDRWSRHFSHSLRIGIGNGYLNLDDVSQSAKEAEYAVQYAPLLLNESSVVDFEELGFYQILIRMQESGISLELFYETYLGNLLGYKKHRTDLILTLEMYLAHNCNMQQTSTQLYIHRHTLKYRLSQIEKRTGLSLQSPDDRMNLHLAILAFKFVELQKNS